ncbi:nuclear protein DGCR14 [Vararia minispora EC-137]|uniref:Nuclear protein DGCR14 n=1 Tax=Vararia minispora EC-137 TaxID=1314806 RepID=A0ACB8QR65_9AGAM|nr:nuclear protein DGCR14 [Vararia minispora EC-137]
MPAPARSLTRQVVLDEDEYTAALSHIIARDFFPSLVHLDATNAYLDAVASDDPTAVAASVRRLETLGATPYASGPSDTPRNPNDPDLDGTRPAKRARLEVSTDMRLDDFQARYTSEDNASFTEILEEENRRRKERYGWAWDAQRRVEGQRMKMLEARERALVEGPAAPGVRERVLIEAPAPKGLITAGEDAREEGKGKSVVLREEDGEEVDVMAPKKDTRPAGVDGWNFKARNSLMFSPDADAAAHEARRPPAATKGEPKVIKHGNTRLPEQEEDASASRGMSEPPSPTRSRIDAAIMGTPYHPRPPGVDTFSYVPAMPSPTPSELGPAAVKQLMTMGTLLGTPRVLSQTDDPAEMPDTPFRIAAPTAREALSQRLSSSASKSLRTKANLFAGGPSRRKGDMGPPSMTPRKADAPGSLTPAARRLLDRTTMGAAATRRAEAMERAAGWEGKKQKDFERIRWTPTPSPVSRR